jgi:hypothetical protein
MTIKIVYKLKDSEEVRVLTPVGDTLDRCRERLQKEHGSNIEAIKEVEDKDLPVDRYFRNAWVVCDKKGAKPCIDKAKKVHMANLRIERNKKLEASDKLMVRALESGDEFKIKKLKNEREALRDMPQNADMTKLRSLNKIKAFKPDIL